MALPKAAGLCRAWPRQFIVVACTLIAQLPFLSSAETIATPPTAVDRALYHPIITIAGTCRDEQRMPVADAQVRLYAHYANREKEELLITVRSNKDGDFILGQFAKPGRPGVHYGRIGQVGVPVVPLVLHVVVLKKGLTTRGLTLPCNRPHELEAVLQPGATLEGRVVGPGGRPVVGAKVSPAGFYGMDGIVSATTDNDGRFVISDLASFDSPQNRTRAGLVVEHFQFGIKQAFYSRCPGSVKIRLEAPAIVKGLIVHNDGRPAAGVKVWSKSTKDDLRNRRFGRAMATTDEQGAYRLLLQGAREVQVGVYETRFPLNDARRRHVIIDQIEVNPGSVQEVPALQLLDDNQILDGH